MRGPHQLIQPSGIATIYTPRRFFLCAALPPLNPLNLLNPPNLFRTQSKGAPPQGLTLNPEP